jgi:rod shape-determining protein MreD
VRGISYLILAYIALGAQIGLSAFIRVGGSPPNLVLLAALFVALNAPKEPALLGCFGLGLMQDLLTQQTLGVYAFSYGIVAMFVISTQQLVYREHPLTHLSIAFSASVICSIIIVLHGLLAYRNEPAMRIGVMKLLYSTIYTTLLAPIVLMILQKLKRVFGFQTRRLKVI